MCASEDGRSAGGEAMQRQLTKQEIWEANNRAETAAKRALPVGATLLFKRNDTAAPSSAEPTTKALRREERHVEKIEKVSFANIMGAKPVDVTKAGDMVEYEIVDGQMRRVDPDIILTSPKPKDGKRDPQN